MLPAVESTVPNVTRRKRRRWWIRLLRGFLFTFLALLALLLLAFAALRILYPPQRLRAMVNQAAIDNLNRRLTLGDVWFHPLKGIILQDVRLGPNPDSTAAFDLFAIRQFRAKKIILQYSLSDIFDKQLHIHDLDIIEPEMVVFVDMLDTTAVDFAAMAQADIPLTVDLRSFRLRNSKIKVILADTLTRQELFIGDLSCTLDDLNLPRGGFARNDSALQVQLHLQSPGSPLLVSQTDLRAGSSMRLKGEMDLDTRLRLTSYHDIALNLGLGLRNLEVEQVSRAESKTTVFRPAIRFEMSAHGDGHAGTMKVDSLILALDGRKWLQGDAVIDSLYGKVCIAASLPYGRIPLAYALDLARELVPAGMLPDLRWLDDRASLTFSGATVSGSFAKGFDYALPLALEHAGMAMNRDSVQVHEFAATAAVKGRLLPGGPEKTGFTLAMGYDSLSLRLPGQELLSFGSGSIKAQAMLNRLMLAENAVCTLQMNNIMGMHLDGEINLKGGASLQATKGNGSLRLTNINFAKFPALPVAGDAAASAIFDINTLDHIAARIRVTTSPITMLLDEEPMLFSDLNLDIRLLAAADTSFSRIRLDSIRLSLNRMLEVSAHAEIINEKSIKVRFGLEKLAIRHDAVWDYLPEALREPFVDAELTGSTTLTAGGEAVLNGENLIYDVTARIATNNTSFLAPAQFIQLNGLGIDTHLSASSRDGIHIAAEIGLDSLRSIQYETIAYHNNKLSLKLASRDFASLIEVEGRLDLPDIFMRGDFQASVADMNANMQVKAQFALKQAVADTLRLPQGISLRGDSDFLIKVEADSGLAHIAADINTRELSFFMPGSMVIRDVNANVHLRQDVDVVHNRLIGSAAYKIATPSNAFMDYMVYRDYYRGRLPNISRVRIGMVEVMDYRVEDIDLELFAGEGRLEIPAIMAKIYGGNMGGRAVIDLAEGDLRKANFEFNLHFAGINSDLILPKRRGESKQGIINANMDLKGIGLDMAAGIKLEGQAYITEIGPRVADNLLRSLDPQGNDSSIRATRLLINRGFKPKLMTFVLRNGYLYPEIIFAQPWYFPMRLSGGKVELARIPLDFFLKSSSQSTASR